MFLNISAGVIRLRLLAQALVHHKFIMDLPDGVRIDEKTGKTAACRVMAVKAYSRTQAKFWYVDFYHITCRPLRFAIACAKGYGEKRESCDEPARPL